MASQMTLRYWCNLKLLLQVAQLTSIQLSIFGERYGIKNDSEILMQSEIAIASSSNEIVELEIAETN